MSDITARPSGSICIITFGTDAGRQWLEENVHWEAWQEISNGIVVDWRTAPAITHEAANDGLLVNDIYDEDEA